MTYEEIKEMQEKEEASLIAEKDGCQMWNTTEGIFVVDDGDNVYTEEDSPVDFDSEFDENGYPV